MYNVKTTDYFDDGKTICQTFKTISEAINHQLNELRRSYDICMKKRVKTMETGRYFNEGLTIQDKASGQPFFRLKLERI